MRKKSRAFLVVNVWFLLVLVCLFAIISGVFIFAGWWGRDFQITSRCLLGGFLILSGFLTGYFGTLRFFWYIIHWLSKNKPNHRKMDKGPKVVVIGGGTGLGTILRGLKEITSNLTAVVTVADDGGSSGRLRREFNILPPGDIRSCLVAMADLEPLMEGLMQYRFSGDSDLAGHNFGNLFLTAMTGVTGDFEAAIKASSKVLAVRGQVLPATLEHVVLKAKMSNGAIVAGESQIARTGYSIREVFLDPVECKPIPEAIQAIQEADVIILGPGSLYTSIIPNLLVKEIAEAIRNSLGIKVYICNAMTQVGETEGYAASEHVQALIEHAGDGIVDIAVVNTGKIPEDILERYEEEGAQPVIADLDQINALGIKPVGIDIVFKSNVIRHDATKLATLIDDLIRANKLENAFGRHIARQISKIFKVFSGIFYTRVS